MSQGHVNLSNPCRNGYFGCDRVSVGLSVRRLLLCGSTTEVLLQMFVVKKILARREAPGWTVELANVPHDDELKVFGGHLTLQVSHIVRCQLDAIPGIKTAIKKRS